jgi:hypothetical protein
MPMAASLLTDRDEMSNHYRGASIDASYQVSVQLAKQFQGRRFLEIDQSETRITWWPCLLSNWDEMSNLYRSFQPSFSSFGKVVSEEKIFRN